MWLCFLSVCTPFKVYAIGGHPHAVIAKQNACGIDFCNMRSLKLQFTMSIFLRNSGCWVCESQLSDIDDHEQLCYS